MFFDGDETLAVLIASPSDVDDLMPMLVAFQIEWNKIHTLLDDPQLTRVIEQLRDQEDIPDAEQLALLAAAGLRREDVLRLRTIWGDLMAERLLLIGQWKKRFAVRMLGGSLMDYERATLRWWWRIEHKLESLHFDERPIYFVSSNTHSLSNLLSGFALRHRDELLGFIRAREHGGLLAEYEKIVAEQVPSSLENFLYYVQKKYQAEPESGPLFAQRAREERVLGIHHIPSRFYVDVDAQVIELSKLDSTLMDPRIRIEHVEALRHSNALIVNIDYPLGLAAYHILKIIGRSIGELRGVYVIGKA